MSKPLKLELFQQIRNRISKGQPLDDLKATPAQIQEALRMGLGDEYIKQSGIYVPSGKSISRLEQFYGDIIKDQYGIDSDIKMDASQFKNNPNARGLFRPNTGEIFLNPTLAENITSGTSTALHEAKHSMDFLKDPNFKPDKRDISRMDKNSSPINQLRQATGRHHLLKDTSKLFEESAIDSIMSGIKKISKLGVALPIIGTAVGLASGDASAAIPSPVGSMLDSESLGARKGSDEFISEDPTATQEDRREALERIRNRNP